MTTTATHQAAPTYHTVQRGWGVLCKFGSHGTQYAIVHSRASTGVLQVVKWQANSDCWTGVVPLPEERFIKVANLEDTLTHKRRSKIPDETWNGRRPR